MIKVLHAALHALTPQDVPQALRQPGGYGKACPFPQPELRLRHGLNEQAVQRSVQAVSSV